MLLNTYKAKKYIHNFLKFLLFYKTIVIPFKTRFLVILVIHLSERKII